MPAHRVVQGNGGRIGGAGVGTNTIIDCSAYGDRLRIKSICISIAKFAAGGYVAITDGTTTHFKWEAITSGGGQPPMVNFPEGYDWGDGLDVVFETNNAITAWCIVVAEARG